MEHSRVLRVLFILTAVAALFPAVTAPGTLICPPNFQIEFRKRSVLECEISDGHGGVYWFKGTDTTVVPIILLEGDQRGGKGYGKGEYHITDEGSLVIVAPQLHHESEYTIQVYFPGEPPKIAILMVNVYIMPDRPCPTISLCRSNCGKCEDITDTSGEILCTINGVRPKNEITWKVIDQTGVSSTIDQPAYNHDGVTDTWNSSISITYNIDGCGGGFAVFQCTGSSAVPLLNLDRNITVTITGTCDMSTSTIIPESEPSPALLSVSIIGVVLIILLLIGCLLYRLGKGYGRKDVRYTDIPLGPCRREIRKVKRLNEGEKKKLILEGLREFYKKLLYVKPIPWDEPVLITSLYTPCKCEIKSEKGGTRTTTSEELLSEEFSFDNKRALIVADLGYGKTTFTQHVVEKWISKKDGSILVYTHLKDVEESTTLSEVVLKMLPEDIGLTQDDIDHSLEANRCHFLLDGLDELSMSLGKHEERKGKSKIRDTYSSQLNDEKPKSRSDNIESGVEIQNPKQITDKSKDGDTSEPNNEMLSSSSRESETGVEIQDPKQNKPKQFRLTIEILLNGQVLNSFTNVMVWVTSRGTNDAKNPFARPFARVKLTGFNNDQLQEYIKKTCKYYIQLRGVDNRTVAGVVDVATKNTKQLETGEAHTSKLTNYPRQMEGHKSEQEKFETLVKAQIDVNNVVKEFSDTPLLLIMVIHIIASKITNPTGSMREVNINKLTIVVRMVISCLESHYVQKTGKASLKKNIDALEAALGCVAFTHKMGLTLMRKERWDTLIGKECCNLALAIGLLRLSKDIGAGTALKSELAFSSYTGAEFYHQYFQEFLAAQHVLESREEIEFLGKYLTSCTDEKTSRFLQFMTGSKAKRTEEVLCTLTKERKLWNNLVDCLFEDECCERVTEIITQISKDARKNRRIMHVTNLTQNYHRLAFANFCDLCREHNMEIYGIAFQEECSIYFMFNCRLPELRKLYFYNMTIGEVDFVKLIEHMARQKQLEQLGFHQCELPKSITRQPAEKIRTAMASSRMEISGDRERQVTLPSFNPNEETWVWRWFRD